MTSDFLNDVKCLMSKSTFFLLKSNTLFPYYVSNVPFLYSKTPDNWRSCQNSLSSSLTLKQLSLVTICYKRFTYYHFWKCQIVNFDNYLDSFIILRINLPPLIDEENIDTIIYNFEQNMNWVKYFTFIGWIGKESWSKNMFQK